MGVILKASSLSHPLPEPVYCGAAGLESSTAANGSSYALLWDGPPKAPKPESYLGWLEEPRLANRLLVFKLVPIEAKGSAEEDMEANGSVLLLFAGTGLGFGAIEEPPMPLNGSLDMLAAADWEDGGLLMLNVCGLTGSAMKVLTAGFGFESLKKSSSPPTSLYWAPNGSLPASRFRPPSGLLGVKGSSACFSGTSISS